MQHIEVDIAGYDAAGDQHTIELVDNSATDGFFGFAVDSIAIHDWVI